MTVMGMIAAWSILNKVHDRSNARYSDVVLAVCPNVTIRSRLAELDPRLGDASLYRKADLVPPHLMPDLTQGHVLITNWHVFEPQTSQAGGVSGRVVKAGRRETVPEIIHIGPKTTTARGRRYLTSEEYRRQVSLGLIEVIDEEKDNDGHVKYARITRDRYVESDAALVKRILGREVGGNQNILVLNAPKPEAVLKWANTPITMLGGLWEELRAAWEQSKDDRRFEAHPQLAELVRGFSAQKRDATSFATSFNVTRRCSRGAADRLERHRDFDPFLACRVSGIPQ